MNRTTLTSITGHNIKDRSFTHELRARTALVGPNMSGKSAILEAIRLVCLGHIPEIGKKASATFELSSGQVMTVKGEFDNGVAVTRQYWQDRGSIKSSVDSTSPLRDGTFFKELESLPLMNAQAYFEMTASQQIDYVFGLVTLPEAFTVDGIVAEMHRLSLGEDHTEAVEKAKHSVFGDLVSGNGVSLQDWLGIVMSQLSGAFTNWNARAKATQGAVTTLTELKLRAREFTADTLAQLGADIRTAEADLATAQEQRGQLQARHAEAGRVASRRRQLEEWLAGSDPDFDGIIAEAKQKLEALGSDLETARISVESTEYDAVASAIATKTEQRAAALAEHTAASAARDALEKNIAALEALDKCPTCQAASKGWKSKVLRGYDAELVACRATAGTAYGLLSALDIELQTLRGKMETMQAAIATAVSWSAEIKALEARISDTERQRDAAVLSRTRAETELAELKAVEAPTTTEHDDNTDALSEARERLRQLQTRRDIAVKLQQDIQRTAQAEQEHVTAVAHVAVIKALQKLVAEKRSGMVDAAFGELLKVANRIGHGILKTPLAFHDGDLGRWLHEADGDTGVAHFIPHRAFSGTEKAVAYIGLAVALSAQSPLRLAILDEFGRLDLRNQEQMIVNLSNAIWEHVIDQFIIATPSPLPETLPAEHALDIIKL